MAKVVVIGSLAESLVNFRGPLFKAMVKRGHHVIACAPEISWEISETLGEMGVTCQTIYLNRTSLNLLKDLNTLFSLIRLFRKLKPDVVLNYTIKPVIYGSIAAKINRVPQIFSMIEGLGYAFTDTEAEFKRICLQRGLVGLYTLSVRMNTAILFSNPDDWALFVQKKMLSSPEQGVVHNGMGVDLDYYAPTPFPEKLSFLLIARLLKDKGLREYANAARIIKQRYPDITFRLVGWLDENPASISQQELDAWIHEGVIEYLGKLSDVRPAIAASSVYVLPSYREGTPRTVLEAMAMGRPIITTDAPGCRETVKNGENGFLIPVKDVSALVAAMERFIQSPELIESMGKASRKIAVEKYDVHKVNAVILEAMGLN